MRLIKLPTTLAPSSATDRPKKRSHKPGSTKHALWLALILLLLTTLSSRAQEPEKVQTFVYGGQVFNGLGYISTFYPPSVDTIYVLAGQRNILSPRQTLVYFWPLSNAYKADWTSMNQIVIGNLDVLDGHEVIATIPQESYVVQWPQGPQGPQKVYTGAEAEARYQAFEAVRQAYRDELEVHNEAMQQYYKDLERARQAREQGQLSELPEERTQEPSTACEVPSADEEMAPSNC